MTAATRGALIATWMQAFPPCECPAEATRSHRLDRQGLSSSSQAEQLHSERIDVAKGALLTVPDKIAIGIAEAMDASFRPYEIGTELDPRAIELYVEARHRYGNFSPTEGMALLSKAATYAPDHPLMLSALAVAHVREAFVALHPRPNGLEWALEAAEKAVRRAPSHGEPRFAQAYVRFHTADIVGAAAAVRQAVARSPSSAEALTLLGMILVEVGHYEEGVRRLELAHSLDANLMAPKWELTRQQALHGDLEGAIAIRRRILEQSQDPKTAAPLARLATWAEDFETLSMAVDMFQRASSREASILTAFPVGAYLGRISANEAYATVERLMQVPGRSARMCTTMYQVNAELAGQLGDVDVLLSSLRKALRFGLIDIVWLDRCPLLGAARGEAGFQQIRAELVQRSERVLDALWGGSDRTVRISS